MIRCGLSVAGMTLANLKEVMAAVYSVVTPDETLANFEVENARVILSSAADESAVELIVAALSKAGYAASLLEVPFEEISPFSDFIETALRVTNVCTRMLPGPDDEKNSWAMTDFRASCWKAYHELQELLPHIRDAELHSLVSKFCTSSLEARSHAGFDEDSSDAAIAEFMLLLGELQQLARYKNEQSIRSGNMPIVRIYDLLGDH